MSLHVLVFNSPLHGHVTPTLGVVAELVRRGNRVTYVTTEQFTEAVRAAGAEPLAYESAWPESISMGEQDGMAGLLALFTNCIAGVRAAQARFARDRPDLILYDTTASAAGRVLAHAWQLPAVEMQPSFASNDTFSLADRIRSKVAARTTMPEFDGSVMAEFTATMTGFLAEFGIPGEQAQEFFQRPEHLSLVFVPRQFQVAADSFDGRYAFVGPCLADRSYQGDFHPVGTDPVVLVSFGTITYERQPEFLTTCVKAFADTPWQVVISTGLGLDPADLGPLPPNVRAHRQLPQLAVLRTADVFVSHAGMGGTMEALSLGVPVLAVPQMPEQEVVADRIEELGLGLGVDAGISCEDLRAAVLDLITDEQRAHSAEHMRRAIVAARGAVRAADEIELYLLSS